MRIRPVGVTLFHSDKETDEHTDRWADMTNLRTAFSDFFELVLKVSFAKFCAFAAFHLRSPSF